MKGKYLITTDNWFFAPDGKQYKAVWGKVEIVGDEVIGIKTNARSSNWFAKVGTTKNHVIVAGCQIHYSVKCNKEPHSGNTEDFATTDGNVKEFIRPTMIYIAK